MGNQDSAWRVDQGERRPERYGLRMDESPAIVNEKFFITLCRCTRSVDPWRARLCYFGCRDYENHSCSRCIPCIFPSMGGILADAARGPARSRALRPKHGAVL